MSSPPPYQSPTNPLKRPSISTASAQSKRPRNHPLRQTSFPTTTDPDSRPFSAASDTGSFTGSLGGTSADGVFARAKKRGRKSKAEKEREREDAALVGGADNRLGSVDADTASLRGAPAGQGAEEEGDDDDLDDEGELLGREEGVTDVEAEKKNLAYVLPFFSLLFFFFFFFSREVVADG